MLEQGLKFVAIGSLAIGAIAAYVAVRNNTLQLGAQIFLAYSDRVRAIRQSATKGSMDPAEIVETTFLIFDFYELRRRRFLPSAVWRMWDRDILDLLRTDGFRRHWDVVKVRFRNHPHFLRWVEAQLAGANTRTEA